LPSLSLALSCLNRATPPPKGYARATAKKASIATEECSLPNLVSFTSLCMQVVWLSSQDTFSVFSCLCLDLTFRNDLTCIMFGSAAVPGGRAWPRQPKAAGIHTTSTRSAGGQSLCLSGTVGLVPLYLGCSTRPISCPIAAPRSVPPLALCTWAIAPLAP
jgi:hypothetical protein